MNDYPSLNVRFPEKEIFLRTGGHLTRTEMSADEKNHFRSLALRAFDRCTPCGRWEFFEVGKVAVDGIILADGTVIAGSDFAARCVGITHLWCGFATAGKAVVALRDRASDIYEKVVFDAVGAETADGAMDMLHALAATELRRHNLIMHSRRYSPGYGDMPLFMQQFFFDRLALSELEISLNEAYYMTPEKSVTAFCGITAG